MKHGLQATDLTHTYSPSTSIGPVSFTIAPGECLGLVGANGSGKTTILSILCGLLTPSSGSLTVNGAAPIRTGPRTSITGMIEEPTFYPFFTATDNLLAFTGGDAERIARIPEALDTVGLGGVTSRFSQYSQGMRQRLGIARVLVSASPVIVLDEPTNGLDPLFLKSFRDIVAGIRARGHMVLLSSHMLHEVQQMCDSYVMLNAGRVIRQGTTADISAGATLEDLFFESLEQP